MQWKLPDMGVSEGLMLSTMMVLLLWLGLYPPTRIPRLRASRKSLSRPLEMSLVLDLGDES